MNVKIPQRAGSKNRDDQKDSKRRVTIFHINAAGATSHRSARAQPAVQPAALALKGSIHQTKPRSGNGGFNASFDTLRQAATESKLFTAIESSQRRTIDSYRARLACASQ
jgi:hypothetical protein